MKKFQSSSYIWLALLLFSLITLPRVFMPAEAAPDAQSSTSLRLSGLRAPVVVRRDARGIPYIEAANEADLYFAQGYITASDRLWQMDLLRRTGRGELAEILGSNALEEDKRHRLYGMAELSEALVMKAQPQERAALEAYARGVNAFIEALDDKNTPPEFRILRYSPRAWRPADSIVIGKVLAESLATSWPKDVMRAELAYLPQDRREAILVVESPLDVLLVGKDVAQKRAAALSPQPDAAGSAQVAETFGELALLTETSQRSLQRVGLATDNLAASNNWVVNGKHTLSHKPMLANDPHLSPSAPSIWHMAHLSAPGLRVAGVTLPGVPGIIIGHNERVAWGITNLGADVQDLYLERFDQENPRRYMTPSGWREAEIRREVIKVRKGFADQTTEAVPFDVTVTRHGPIVFEKDNKRYALRWAALDARAQELAAFYLLDRARNWKEFRGALNVYLGPGQNFVYTDVDGHIGYYAAGLIPVRKAGDGSQPYDGATDDGEWTGFIRLDALPHVYDPPSGILVTANQRVVGKDYPYLLTREWVDPYRARRIYNLLSSKARLSIDDFRAIQGDTYSFGDAIFTSEVVKMARPLAANSDEWRAMLTMFDGWDAISKADSRVMPLAATMRTTFQRRVLLAALGAEQARGFRWANLNTFIDEIIRTRPRAWLPTGFDSYEALILACYKDARTELAKQLGADESQWTWGRMGQVRFPHPLAGIPQVGSQFVIEPFPRSMGGSGPTVNSGAGVSMRFIVDLSNWDETRQGLSLGESGNPASPHWKDQLADWRGVTPGIFPFTVKAVASVTQEPLSLMPLK